MTRAARPSLALALALTALVLGACTARDETRLASGVVRHASLDALVDRGPGRAGATAPTRPVTPVAVLPDWIGRPTRLRDREGADLYEQAVSLDLSSRGSARENLVLLRLYRADAGADAADRVTGPGGRPTEAGIRAELASAFPGTEMQVVTRPAANAYGPYGFAVGRAPGGARCLYAWQWIAAAPDLDPASGRPGPLSLRVRLCRADITLEAMAAAMNQIKLVPRHEGTAVGTAAISHHAVRTVQRPARPRHAAGIPGSAPAGPPTQSSATPVGVAAPAGRRYLGVPDATASDEAPPRGADPGPAALSRAFVGAPPPAPSEGITADLPPEALRGPVARVAARP